MSARSWLLVGACLVAAATGLSACGSSSKSSSSSNATKLSLTISETGKTARYAGGTSIKGGTLPSTSTTVTAATAGKDKYKWQLSGPLKLGANRFRFVSKGTDALHLVGVFRVTGNPSKSQLISALKSNGKPPAFVDTASF